MEQTVKIVLEQMEAVAIREILKQRISIPVNLQYFTAEELKMREEYVIISRIFRSYFNRDTFSREVKIKLGELEASVLYRILLSDYQLNGMEIFYSLLAGLDGFIKNLLRYNQIEQ